MSGSILIKMNKATVNQDGSWLLIKPGHALSDRYLPDLFKFASKPAWKKRFCYSSAQKLNLLNSIHSADGISSTSADALILVLTSPMERFIPTQEF